MALRIGILGSGPVSTHLANGFLRHGYQVIRGSRNPVKLEAWSLQAGENGTIGDFATAAHHGDLLVLAVKGSAAERAIRMCPAACLIDKTIIDVTNPIADEPPEHGVLKLFTPPNESLMERLQRMVPKARFVKAFSSIGCDLMVNPDFGVIRPTMFICGNDPIAKTEVRYILEQFGWETEDLGRVESARAIEPLSLLWCLRGWARGRWDHAFKLLRVERRQPVSQSLYPSKRPAWATEDAASVAQASGVPFE